MAKSIRTIATAIACFSILAGCGFHLRGKVDLPESLSRVYVESDSRDLRTHVRDALEFAGSSVATEDGDASAVVDLFDVNYKREVLTTDLRGTVTAYTLRYIVRYRVKNAAGRAMIEDSRIEIERNLQFDPQQVLQTEAQEKVLREEMEKEIAQRIIRRLAFIA